MPRILKATLLAGALLLGAGLSVRADTVTFNFNSLGTGQTNGVIRGYMDGVMDGALGPGNWVSAVTGAITDKTYDGDDRVTGPLNGGGNRKSLTLGTSDGATNGTTPTPTGTLHPSGATDTFVRNQSGVSSFSFSFTGFPIYWVSFDFEIFPDATCANGTGGCGTNWPDFTFQVSNGSTSQIFQYFGVMPGTATATPGAQGSTTAGWTSYDRSPYSGTNLELAPQLLGTWSGALPFPATTLTFKDWPATVGIDNLVIHTPEPGSILLLGTALAGLIFLNRKRRSS
jgi:hypothetical protein